MSSTDVTALLGFAEALRRAPVAAMDAATTALNEAAVVARDQGVDLIDSRYNLEKPYIQKHLTVNQQARRTDLLARISAKRRSVLAPRYGASQATQPAKGAKGDPYRKIPAGMKGAGSTAWSVKKGGNKTAWRNAFFVKLKTSGAWGMVARTGQWSPGLSRNADWKQNLKVISSLSVDQAWRGVRDEVAPQAMALAQERFLEEMERSL